MYELTDAYTAVGVCRVPALGNIPIYEGEHASRLLTGGSECEVYTCQVHMYMYICTILSAAHRNETTTQMGTS